MCYDYWPYTPQGPILLSPADAPYINELFTGFIWVVGTYCAFATCLVLYLMWRGK